MSVPDSSTFAIHTLGPLTFQDTTAFLESIHISPIKTDNTKETGAKIDEIVKLRFIQPDNTLQDVCVSKTQLRVVLQSSELRKEALASNTAIVEFFENKLKEFQNKKISTDSPQAAIPATTPTPHPLHYTIVAEQFQHPTANMYISVPDETWNLPALIDMLENLSKRATLQEQEFGKMVINSLCIAKNYYILDPLLTVICKNPQLKSLFSETIRKATESHTDLFQPKNYTRTSACFSALCQIMEIIHDNPMLNSKHASIHFLPNLIPSSILYAPDKALSVMQKYRYDFDAIPVMHFMGELKKYTDLGLAPEQEKAFLACIHFLTAQKLIVKAPIPSSDEIAKNLQTYADDTLAAFAMSDRAPAFEAVYKMVCDLVPGFIPRLESVLEFDSVECLKIIITNAKYTPQNTTKKDRWNILTLAFQCNSRRCIEFIISYYKTDQADINVLCKSFSFYGYAQAVLMLFNNSMERATDLLFAKVLIQLEINVSGKIVQETMNSVVWHIMRVTPLDVAENMISAFIARFPIYQNSLNLYYQNAKKNALKTLPVIARITRPVNLVSTHKTYAKQDAKNYDFIAEDEKYGIKRRNQIEQILYLLNTKSAIPSGEFDQLQTSESHSQRAAYCLEQIQRLNPNVNIRDHEAFTLRVTGFMTPLELFFNSYYGWAIPILANIKRYSKAPDFARDKVDALTYQGTFLSYTDYSELSEDHAIPVWIKHGRSELETSWGYVEDAFEKMMNFNLKRPAGDTKQGQEIYDKQLKEFYEGAAELVWLVGNIQPFKRGSGTVAEYFFALVHLKHGLEPPVLKVQFSQLDVLDIIFPLSDYKKLFPYFFEPSTMPEHLRRPDLPGSVLEQMEALYKEINK